MKRILIAPNSFRGSLNALEVAQALRKGIESFNPHLPTTLLPIADGGDYFSEVMVFALNGELHDAVTIDPLGREIKAKWGRKDDTAFIEVAKASGTNLLQPHELNPYQTSTFGTGLLIKEAISSGCKKIVIGLGGSATVDAGVGILQALGFSFLDKNQREIGAGGAQLLHVESIRTDNILPKLAQCNFELICDVDNPLLGEEGAAKVFGPQKGASAAQVEVLETALSHFAQLTENLLHKSVQNLKYGGAAGGIAAFLHAFINAELKAGTETVLDLLHFNEHLSQNDVVITGEGKLDVQTLNGKGPHGVALRAKHFGKKVIGIAGAIPHEQLHLYNDFDLILSTCNQPMSLEEAMNSAEAFIENTGYKIGQILTF